MRPTDAVHLAKAYLTETFASEGISQITLEEIEYDHDHAIWNITLGFLRNADFVQPLPDFLQGVAVAGRDLPRVYKVVKLRDEDGSVSSVTIRTLAA